MKNFGISNYPTYYKRLEVILNGIDSTFNDKPYFTVITDEWNINYFIKILLKNIKVDRPYVLENAVFEKLNDTNRHLYISNITDLMNKIKELNDD